MYITDYSPMNNIYCLADADEQTFFVSRCQKLRLQSNCLLILLKYCYDVFPQTERQ